jgi:predicted component of type VI protein secretion system
VLRLPLLQIAELRRKLEDAQLTLDDREEAAAQLQQLLQAADADLDASQDRLGTTLKDASAQMQVCAARRAGRQAGGQQCSEAGWEAG